ncbi:MAG: LacI family DNA-binding transcriptional regulator [Actinomycetota bacterium]
MGSSRAARASGNVTSHDVATEAGVSQATVARVFSSPEKVADATRAKVLEAADRLGYVPNAIARSLKAQRTDIIGAIVPATGEYWQHVLTLFSGQLIDRGRQLLLFSFAEPDEVSAVIETVARYRLDGLIAASASLDISNLHAVERTEMPVVAFNQPAATGLLPSVTVDNELGMQDLADHVVARGAQSALFVGGVATTSTDQQRYRGAASRLGDHGVACPYVEAGAFTYEAGHKVAGHLADRDLPDAVLVGSDEVAFGVIDGLRERGYEAPRDLFLTGFDGLPQARWAAYDLTTLEQPTALLVDHAISHLLDDATAVSDTVVPGTIRQGRTTDHA